MQPFENRQKKNCDKIYAFVKRKFVSILNPSFLQI